MAVSELTESIAVLGLMIPTYPRWAGHQCTSGTSSGS